MNSSPLRNCFYNINNQLPNSTVIDPFVNYCINPRYNKDWFFNRDIINFINNSKNYFLEIDGEVLAFKC
jgi:hypothetical protein